MNIIAGDQYLSIAFPAECSRRGFPGQKTGAEKPCPVVLKIRRQSPQFGALEYMRRRMRNFLGTPQWGAGGYAPYAILCYINPLISIFYGFTGISMEKISDEEYEKIP